jgi:uncharacterized membrane protein
LIESKHALNPLASARAARWALLCITWVAFLLRVPTLHGQSLWRDEIDTVYFAGWSPQLLIQGLVAIGHNGPLYFLLLHPWQNVTGISEFAVRYPSAVMGTLAVPLAFLLARQLGLSRRVGLLFSLLLASSPYLIWYGQEAKMYTILLVVVMLAFMAHFKAMMGHGNHWWVIFVLATTLSFYLHILAPMMLPVYVAMALVFQRQLRWHWRGWLISMACLTVPYLPLVIWQLSVFVDGASQGHPFYPLREQFYLLLQLYSSGLIKSAGLTAIVLVVFLLLAGLFLTSRQRRDIGYSPRIRLMLAAWLLLPPLAVYLISLRVPVFEDRYVIHIAAPFYLLLAMGIALVRQHSRGLAAFCLGLLLVINLTGIWQQQRQPIKADFRSAAAYLAGQPAKPATVIIQMPYLKRTFDYYYPHPYDFLEGLWTNGGKSDAEVDVEMLNKTAQLTDVWLVVSEEDAWDNRKLMRAWLDDNAQLLDEMQFMRVSVYHYQFNPGNIELPALTR